MDNTSIAKPQGYPYRITSFITSLGVHCALIASLALLSTGHGPPIDAISTDWSQMNVRKVLIYDIRTKPADVVPLKSFGMSPKPRGTEVSKQTVIATSPKAKSTEQFIWQPVPKLQLKQDLRMPNLIARMATSLPAPSAPPKEKQQVGQEVKAPKQARAFVPPLTRQPQLPLPSAIPDSPALPGELVAMNPPLGDEIIAHAFSKGVAPPPVAPVALVANPGNARVDIAIASLHPNDANRELPEGERPGRFSKAPARGMPETGEMAGSPAVIVPNLTIREDRTKSMNVPENKSNEKAILYTDKVRSVGASTLSVPLRPSSRTIPRAVDARFQGRNVYTMVIPIENLPAYAGDWIVWFAEREPKPGDTPLMRAPLPFRKLEPVDQPIPGTSAGERVQVMGILQKDGRLDGITAFAKTGAAVEQAIMRDVASWEFRPATRNGVAVAVEVVIEIPFVFQPALAKRTQP